MLELRTVKNDMEALSERVAVVWTASDVVGKSVEYDQPARYMFPVESTFTPPPALSPDEPPNTVESRREFDPDCEVSNFATKALPGESVSAPVVVGKSGEDAHPEM